MSAEPAAVRARTTDQDNAAVVTGTRAAATHVVAADHQIH
jgi:hypothetical protein